MSNTGRTTQHHVSRNGESVGPWTIDEIVERLGRSEISMTDFIFDEIKGDWITLLECEALKVRLNQQKPKAPPAKPVSEAKVKEEESTAEPAEWYVLKGEHRFGPFSYLNLVKALQEKSVYEFDFIWKEGMSGWVRLAEHPEFQPEQIRNLKTTASTQGIFFERRMPRLPYECEVIVHDERSAWLGRSIEGSAGGSGLVIENSTLVPGQIVRLHFAPVDGLPAFNAVGEIVSKKFTREVKSKRTPVKYGVRFIAIDESIAPKVAEYFQQPLQGAKDA